MTVIGLTGPTGAGKSTVMEAWRGLGAVCMDADAVYHRLLREDGTLLHALRERFPSAFTQDNSLDRKALGRIVFADAAERNALEEMTHPAVIRALRQTLAGLYAPAAVIEAIALFGSGADTLCHVSVAVLAPAEQRLRRIMARDGLEADYARMRVQSQPDDAYYQEKADYTLWNDAGEEALRREAERLYHQILKEAIYRG